MPLSCQAFINIQKDPRPQNACLGSEVRLKPGSGGGKLYQKQRRGSECAGCKGGFCDKNQCGHSDGFPGMPHQQSTHCKGEDHQPCQGIVKLSQHLVFFIAVLVVLVRRARFPGVGKGVGVFHDHAIVQQMVMPVGYPVVEKQEHGRDYHPYSQFMLPFIPGHALGFACWFLKR